jgi:predicted translin family RNA/ssDNA-binding protein
MTEDQQRQFNVTILRAMIENSKMVVRLAHSANLTTSQIEEFTKEHGKYIETISKGLSLLEGNAK